MGLLESNRKWGSSNVFLVFGERTFPPTGLGQGEVLAEEGLFSFSSGSSTEDIRMFFADSNLRLCTGLEGAVDINILSYKLPQLDSKQKITNTKLQSLHRDM